jgi:hypothetical protein
MIAGEAEVVGEHMAIEFFTELSTEGAATCTSSEPAEDGTRDCAEGEANRAGNSADLATSKRGAYSASGTAHRASGGSEFHGCS